MSRASGRKNLPREPVLPGDPADDAQGKEIGESARQNPAGSPIPGLTGNIVNYPTVTQKPATPDGTFDEYRGIMAHGVPNDSETTNQRGLQEATGTIARQRQPPTPPQPAGPLVRPVPVPVYIVTEGAGARAYLTSSPRNVTVPPNANADPVRECGRDAKRNRIGLLNEDTATNIRFAYRPSDLVNGGGALLPWPATSYLFLETQDELFACTVSATLSVIMSVIEEHDQEL
jgi:hypothetical protein